MASEAVALGYDQDIIDANADSKTGSVYSQVATIP